MLVDGCVSCATVTGHIVPPGGIIHENDFWMYVLRSQPLLVVGEGFIVLKRHCEHLGELDAAELATLGPMMQHAHQALDRVLKPAKVHFGLYAESIKHIHLHVFPRMPDMPVGNIPITILGLWYRLLVQLHLKRPYRNATVAELARQLRTASEPLMS